MINLATTENAVQADDEAPSIEDLEKKLKASPGNTELQTDLVYALTYRYWEGTEDRDAGDEQDLNLVRGLLKDMPETSGLLPRAYLSFVDKKYEEAARWLSAYVAGLAEDGGTAPSCDKLVLNVLNPFGNDDCPNSFWEKLSEALDHNFPESAAAFYVRGFVNRKDDDLAASCYKMALDNDSSYWMAALKLAYIFAAEQNWKSAAIYFAKAQESKSDDADLHYWYASCLYFLKNYGEAVNHYRKCLELAPETSDARNDLGWTLMKLGQHEEALKVFDECINLGEHGKRAYCNRAYCNRARALAKLRRFEESLEAWKLAYPKGTPKSVQTEVDRVNKLITSTKNVEKGSVVSEVLDDDPGDEEDQDESYSPISQGRALTGKEPSQTNGRTSFQNERWLEECIESLINSGEKVFNRKLRLDHSDKDYGRQFTIPVGRIDLLAEDIGNGDLVVIELKKDNSDDIVVGQILRYMKYVQEKIAGENHSVVGVVCVFRASDKLKVTARNCKDLELFEYDLVLSKL